MSLALATTPRPSLSRATRLALLSLPDSTYTSRRSRSSVTATASSSHPTTTASVSSCAASRLPREEYLEPNAPPRFEPTQRIWRRPKGYHRSFHHIWSDEELADITKEHVNREFSNWLDPTPRSASPTVEAATDLRILLHKVCQKWPLTTPWAYEASVALGIVLFPCWDATPPFRIAHTCWTPPKNLHACLRGIETVLSCEGLPERGTEMEKAVDLDWTAAGAVWARQQPFFGNSEGPSQGGLATTVDDLWASWKWVDNIPVKVKFEGTTSVLSVLLGLRLGIASGLFKPYQTFRHPLIVRAINPHPCENLVDNYSRLTASNTALKALYLFMAQNRIAKLIPHYMPGQKRHTNPVTELARARVVDTFNAGNYKLSRCETWVDLPDDLQGMLVQLGRNGKPMMPPGMGLVGNDVMDQGNEVTVRGNGSAERSRRMPVAGESAEEKEEEDDLRSPYEFLR